MDLSLSWILLHDFCWSNAIYFVIWISWPIYKAILSINSRIDFNPNILVDATHDKDLKPLELENYDVTTNMSFTIKNRATDLEFMAVADSGNAKDIPQTVTFKGEWCWLLQKLSKFQVTKR